MVTKKGAATYRREIAQVLGWFCLTIGVLAIMSFNPLDATLFYHASSNGVITNWCGIVGAQAAGLLFFLFGSASYVLLLATILPVYRYLIGSKLRVHALVFGVVCLVATLAVAGGLYNIDVHALPPGGLVGGLFARWLRVLFGGTGSLLCVWGLVWIQVVRLFELPLLPLLKMVFAATLLPLGNYAFAGLQKLSGVLLWWRSRRPTESIDQTAQDEYADVILAAASGIKTTTCEEPVAAKAAEVTVDIPRLAVMPLRTAWEFKKVFKTPYKRAPNTRLQRNPFAVNADGIIPYDMIVQAYNVKQEQAFQLPDGRFFAKPDADTIIGEDAEVTAKRAEKIKEKLQHFGVHGTVVGVKTGPVVTMYEYKPDINSKISKIVGLEDDLAMALTAQSMRIIAPIPGKNAVGFEIANTNRQSVLISQLIDSTQYQDTKAALPIILGVDAMGNHVIEDLATTPHLLVGGATGAGKSVGLNVLLLSLLCKRTPDELKLILIDPKRLEFTPYADIPHLLFPIVTQAGRASVVLAWVVHEMERRYTAMSQVGVRNVHEYRKAGHAIPFLVVIIDELADLMMVAGKEVEMHIVRIAQMARAAGIHLIVATQRPSVDVMTGLIKVNFPSRLAFRVSSKIDSRTILDSQGAEKLLGRGDMLYMHASSADLRRVHCPYVTDAEVEKVAAFLRKQRKVEYVHLDETVINSGAQQLDQYDDDLYGQVCTFVQSLEEISISMLQRQYRIGFNRSARLIEKLESDGVIAPAQGSKPRKVLR